MNRHRWSEAEIEFLRDRYDALIKEGIFDKKGIFTQLSCDMYSTFKTQVSPGACKKKIYYYYPPVPPKIQEPEQLKLEFEKKTIKPSDNADLENIAIVLRDIEVDLANIAAIGLRIVAGITRLGKPPWRRSSSHPGKAGS